MLNLFFRLYTYLRHRCTAIHSHGNGIHSPHLFYIVNMLCYDDNAYYCFAPIEHLRQQLLHTSTRIPVLDYGTGTSQPRKVARMARRELMPKQEAQTLFRIVEHLHPHTILELGTSFGITTSYLASAAPQASVFTFEGNPAAAKIAQKIFIQLHCHNIHLIEGNIDHTLTRTLPTIQHIDFALLDANHTEEATLRYFHLLLPHCHEDTILAFDDIYYSPAMLRAWKQIQAHPQVTTTINCYHFGLVFFNPQYLHKHYTVHL